MRLLPARGRLPTESDQAILVFAALRVALVVLSLVVTAAAGFPYEGRLAGALAGVALPFGLIVLGLTWRSRPAGLSPLIAVGDAVVLSAIQLAAPDAYGAVHFSALALLAVHAHFQGARIGAVIAALVVAALGTISALEGDGVVSGPLLVFYECVFAAAALVTVSLVGRFRTDESASRLRARELTRRTLQNENDIRRSMSEALHDGPVQDLIAADMMLTAAGSAAERGQAERSAKLIAEARLVVERNIRGLRDEMVDLGPYAYNELSFATAVERCAQVWERRYELRAQLDIDPALDLPSAIEGDLFRITQEAVTNAGRHGHASEVRVRLGRREQAVVLEIGDDGRGFDSEPLGGEPGHIGLQCIRERTELMAGRLEIESSPEGSTVRVTLPRPSGVPA